MSRLAVETELIQGLRNGDQTSYKKLVEKYWNELNFLAVRLVADESVANDCVQETFIKAITKIDTFEERGSLRGWLHQITVNEALTELRKKSARKEESLDEFMLEFDETGHYVDAYRGEAVSFDVLQESVEVERQLKQSIDKLPDKFRIILILRDFVGFSTKEVADKLDMTEQNVKVRLHRARLALRNLLKPVLREQK